MTWKTVLSLIFFIIVIALLVFYWFIPLGETEFRIFGPGHSNFTLNSSTEESMQFYENLRYSESRISYRIEDCTLEKADEMKNAFKEIESKTVLNFYSVSNNEEILITCESKTRFEGEFFIAGEGGPTNITQAGDFNVIHNGGIILLRDSRCERPNIAIHELLHALGFDHSKNPENIMYEVSRCGQEIGQDSINVINELYSVPSLPDLTFENASASMKGRYLDISMVVRNNGLKNSENAKIIVYADEDSVKELEIEALPIGSGKLITLTNIFVLQTSVSEIKLSIDYNPEELKKENNIISLKVKS
ncbi:matrixin family metalloprotease [Candidatus Pacearchaeota archaeon]|nr:matrixin family metalloprotease [Candidatus Pacearchaeota archaeon]